MCSAQATWLLFSIYNDDIVVMRLETPGAERRNLRQGFCLSRINSHLVIEDLWMVLLLLQKESDSVDNDTTLDLAVPLKAQTRTCRFKKQQRKIFSRL